MRGGRYYHSAHHARIAQVSYRHHPLFGHEVEVVRAIRHGIEPSVIVRTSEGLQIAVPCWMLDGQACAALKEEDSPRVCISALVKLAELIELHRNVLTDTSGLSPQQGASDEPETYPCTISNGSSV